MNLLFSCATLSNYETRKPSSPSPKPHLSENASDWNRKDGFFTEAGCVGCLPEGKHLAGDRDLPTIFGRFYAPNISTDLEGGSDLGPKMIFVEPCKREYLQPIKDTDLHFLTWHIQK